MPVLRSAFIALSHNRSLRRFCEHSSAGHSPQCAIRRRHGARRRVARRRSSQPPGHLRHARLSRRKCHLETEAHRAADVYHKLARLDRRARPRRQHQRQAHANGPASNRRSSPSPSSEISFSMPTPLAELCPHRHGRFPADPRSRSTSCAASTRSADLRGAVGVVIQAYLYRSQADVEQLLADGIRVRLCKGAYDEPPEVAFPQQS